MIREIGSYAGAGLIFVVVGVLLPWPWLDEGGRRGLLMAAAVAWPVQVVSFGFLVGTRHRQRHFLAVWAGGTLVRMGVIGAAAYVLTRIVSPAPAPTLLGLAGFFFGLLLLEPVFFRRRPGENRDEREEGRREGR